MKREEKSKQTLFLVKTGKYSKIFVNARALWEERVKAEKQGTSSGNPQHQNVIPRCQECPKVQSSLLCLEQHVREREWFWW